MKFLASTSITMFQLFAAGCQASAAPQPEQAPRDMTAFKHRYLPEIRPNIVGGEPVYPQFVYGEWMVAIMKNDYQFCAGSLFGPNLMVTAGHCSVLGIPLEYLRVVAHRYNLSRTDDEEGAVVMSVRKINVHPLFNFNTLDHDVAVWELEGGDALKEVVRLDNGVNSWVGRNCTVMGWGATDEMADGSEVLREVQVPVFDQNKCKQTLGGRVTDAMICAGGFPGKDACQGDSGGPMVVMRRTKSPVLVGVVSWGRGCARANYPGVYARVSSVRTWLRGFLPQGYTEQDDSAEDDADLETNKEALINQQE